MSELNEISGITHYYLSVIVVEEKLSDGEKAKIKKKSVLDSAL